MVVLPVIRLLSIFMQGLLSIPWSSMLILPRWPMLVKAKKDTRQISLSGVFVLALPIFPGRRQPSIVGRDELNYRVRNGNGWTLALISTNFMSSG